MKQCIYILLSILVCSLTLTSNAQSRSGSRRGGFSLSNLTQKQTDIPDSLLTDSTTLGTRRLNAYQLTPILGDYYEAEVDTLRENTANSTLVEGKSLSIAHLGNLGSPSQSRIFRERKEARDFIFADTYDPYIITPEKAKFYNTKVPYTNIMYTTAGGSLNKEEQLKGILTINFGKKLNVGGDFDYIYGRGYYQSNSTKLIGYRIFSSYNSDRYEAKAYIRNYSVTNYENGGLTNDSVLTHPDNYAVGKQMMKPKDYPVRYINTWNKVSGTQIYLTHRYNLGFTKTLKETDEEGNPKEQFVPVSSIIHTIDYEQNRRHFLSDNSLDANYPEVYTLDEFPNDSTSAWVLKNTLALSLREGFQDWAKFGLTGFIRMEQRKFRLPYLGPMDNFPDIQSMRNKDYSEFSTYIGAELSKRLGTLFTYNANGELCVVGDDIGEFRANGEMQTQFKLFNKNASVKATGYIKNVTPAFYLRHNYSKYFKWENEFSNIQQFYAGGEVNIESTKTKLSAGVESIQNYVYFGNDGYPVQHNGNIQVISANLKQDFRYRAFGWENEICYQLSSNKSVLPLPAISAYSNLYLSFKVVKVLSIQLGADVHYHTSYYAPYYEPATQQFQTQSEVKVGNYPLINAYVNCHLKQARFFVTAYNLGSQFINPNYFSLAHYPLNPMMIKMGVAVMFNN